MATGRETRLAAPKAGLATITTANGYNQTVAEVHRGFKHHTECQNRPALCFNTLEEPMGYFAQTHDFNDILVDIWGYIDLFNPASLSLLTNFAGDVYEYLSVTWTYRGWTDILSQRILEAGRDDLIGIFQMGISIKNIYQRGSP